MDVESIVQLKDAVTLILQVGVVVWGASAIASKMRQLSGAIEKLTTTVEKLDRRVDDHDTRLAVLEHDARKGVG